MSTLRYVKNRETKQEFIPNKPNTGTSRQIDSPFNKITQLQTAIGNQAVARLLHSGAIQAKMTMSKPGDKYEQEADRIADTVVRMSGAVVQTKTAHRIGKSSRWKDELAQRKALSLECAPLIQKKEEEKDENIEELKAKVAKLVNKKFGGSYRNAFDHYDSNNDKSIDADELKILLKDADVGNWATRKKWVSGIIERIDKNKNGRIEWSEFEAVTKKPKKQETAILTELQNDSDLYVHRQPEKERGGVRTKQALNLISGVTSPLGTSISSIKGRGRPLSQSERAFFEPQYDCDFSSVRLHTGSEEVKSARAINARAYTAGRNLVFGSEQYAPGNLRSMRLLAHELAYVVQQNSTMLHRYRDVKRRTYEGEEAPRKRRYEETSTIPKTFKYETAQQKLLAHNFTKAYIGLILQLEELPGKSPHGQGWHPPSEEYSVATGIAPENTHVLFKGNTNVTLPNEGKKLSTFITKYKKPIEINIHGYASVDGTKEYNLNLSAHRAVASKKVLIKYLPGGSKAEAFAHGETKAFGAPQQNRRTGIEVKKPPMTTREGMKKEPSTREETGFTPPYSTPSDLFKLRQDPQFLMQFGSLSREILTPDYSKLREPFARRGLTPDSKYWKIIDKQWLRNYILFNRKLGLSPKMSKYLSDFSTSFYVDQNLYFQIPTRIEQYEQKFLEQPTIFKVDIFDLINIIGEK